MSPSRIDVSVKLRLLNERGEAFLGPGPVALLRAIDGRGSILKAARSMDMSYTKALGLVRSLERNLGAAVVASTIGGAGGGGSALTPFGRDLVKAYRAWEAEVEGQARRSAARLKRLRRKRKS